MSKINKILNEVLKHSDSKVQALFDTGIYHEVPSSIKTDLVPKNILKTIADISPPLPHYYYVRVKDKTKIIEFAHLNNVFSPEQLKILLKNKNFVCVYSGSFVFDVSDK